MPITGEQKFSGTDEINSDSRWAETNNTSEIKTHRDSRKM